MRDLNPPFDARFVVYCSEREANERQGDKARAASFVEYEAHLQVGVTQCARLQCSRRQIDRRDRRHTRRSHPRS